MGLSLLHEVLVGGEAARKALCMFGVLIIARVAPPLPPTGDKLRFSSLRLKNEVRKVILGTFMATSPSTN